MTELTTAEISNGIVDRKVSMHEMIQAVNEYPGSSVSALAYYLRVPTRRINGIHSLATKGSPYIKRIKQDGVYRFYPNNWGLSTDEGTRSSAMTVMLEGTVVSLVRVNAAEVEKMDRRQKRGKYGEILDILDGLDIDEGVMIAADKISRDGLRGSITSWFGKEKTFTSRVIDGRVVILRAN